MSATPTLEKIEGLLFSGFFYIMALTAFWICVLFYLGLSVAMLRQRGRVSPHQIFEGLLAGQTTRLLSLPCPTQILKARGPFKPPHRPGWQATLPLVWSVRPLLLFQLHCSHPEHIQIAQGKRRLIEEEKATEDSAGVEEIDKVPSTVETTNSVKNIRGLMNRA